MNKLQKLRIPNEDYTPVVGYKGKAYYGEELSHYEIIDALKLSSETIFSHGRAVDSNIKWVTPEELEKILSKYVPEKRRKILYQYERHYKSIKHIKTLKECNKIVT